MKKKFFLACVWTCTCVGLVAGQVPDSILDSKPKYPPSPVKNKESNSEEIQSNPTPVGTGPGDMSNLDPPIYQEEWEAGPDWRFWVNLDYLLWWLKPVCLKPPTLTVGSPADAVPGAIGQPQTQVIQGDHKFEFNGASGFNGEIGTWLTTDRVLSFETGGFFLGKAVAHQDYQSSPGGAPVYIPFQDPSNVNQALRFFIPGVVNASSVAVGSSQLWGAEGNLASHFSTSRGGFLLSGSLLVGFRFLSLEDQVTVTNQQELVSNPAAIASGSDTFKTINQFYGGQVGTRLGLAWNSFSVDLLTKMALGITHQVSDISGNPLLPGSAVSPLLLPGPFLALPSNIGVQSANRITLVPEMALTFHYQLTNYLSLNLGYSCLYWNKILCPGDQMDTHVNVTQLPYHGPFTGTGLPAMMLVHTDAFAQGIHAGLEFHF